MIYIIRLRSILCVLLSVGVIISIAVINLSVPTIATKTTNRTVIIDAGHGGGDPGAIGLTGSLEKDINLSISLKLQKLIEKNGGIVLMTRTDDNSLASSKREDMKVRKKLREENSSDIFVSIHLNSYPYESCKGAQTFYSNNEESKLLGEKIQKNMVKYLDENNTRIAKKLTDVYLLKNVNIPSVIVECGFLSNSREEELLKSEDYQDKIAFSIYAGILEYFGEEKIEQKDDAGV